MRPALGRVASQPTSTPMINQRKERRECAVCRRVAEQHALMNGASAIAEQTREMVLDSELRVPDDRGVTHIETEDVIAGHR